MGVGVRLVDVQGKEVAQPVYTASEIVSRVLDEKVKDVIKLVRYGSFYVGEYGIKDMPVIQEFGSTMGDFKNALSARELYRKSLDVQDAVGAFFSSPSLKNAHGVFMKSTAWFNSFADTVEFAARFVPLNKLLALGVKRCNVIMTLGFAGSNAVKDFNAFDTCTSSAEQISHLLKLAVDVSYVAFSTFCLSCWAMGVVPAASVVITCLTAGTVFALADYVYNMACDPARENKHVNMDALRKRLVTVAA